MPFDSFGDYLLTLQLLNIGVMLVSFYMWNRQGRPNDPTDENWPSKWLLAWVLTFFVWLLLLVVHLVYMLVIRDWLGVAIDTALLIWVWWDFFGGKGKWKKWKKRAKERVAVIKGRLKVVPIPAPSPA